MEDENNYGYKIEKKIGGAPSSIKIDSLKIIIKQSEKSICKIKCKDGGCGTGFFSLIPFPDQTMRLRTLMTNYHILNKSDVEMGKKIEFSVNNDNKKFNIIIDSKRKVYSNKTYDITIIELKKEDGIKDDSYLEIDEQIFEKKGIQEFIHKSVYLLHYPNGEKAENSQGEIKSMALDGYNIQHLCSSSNGSSGSPILFFENHKVMGIHKGGEKKDVNWNLGTLLRLPIEKFNEKFINKDNEEKEKQNLNINDNENNEYKNYKIKDNKNITNVNENKNIIINISKKEENNIKNDEKNENENKNIIINISKKEENNFKNEEINKNENNNNINNNYYNINDFEKDIINKNENKNKNIDEITIVYKKLGGVNAFELQKKLLYKQTISKDKIFGEVFVQNNRNNCKIIYKGKEYKLCSYLKEVTNEFIDNQFSIKLKGISKITNASFMFMGCLSLFSVDDLSEWDTKNIISLEGMFLMCENIQNLPDMSKWNTKNVENLHHTFGYCKSLTFFPDISNWNTSKVNDISYLFEGCKSLTNLPDISKWDTFSVIKMNGTFQTCTKIELIPDISNWMTYNVREMKGLFFECFELLFLPDISKWNTDNVENMSGMFYDCNKLNELPDISKWNVYNVKDMSGMFRGCKSLSSFPDILKWNLNPSVKTNDMFICFSKNAITDNSKWNNYKIKFNISNSTPINDAFDNLSSALVNFFIK